ncbi:MAG: TonB-dependent receptor [Acidobacteriota bacterium]
MKSTRVVLIAILLVVASAAAGFAQQTGDIRGRVSDNTGAVLPGATVTLTTPTGTQQTAITSDTGTFVFPRLAVGVYSVRFELAGFKTVVRDGVRITIGLTADVNQVLEISAVQETVTVTGETPVVDTTETGTAATFNREMMQSIPSARDPWVIIEQAPGVVMDRANVGGSQSGQQSAQMSRGQLGGQNKWTLDGVDITDMSATGASPIYYDFDMLEEMQVVTGGADASQQTSGLGINMVTRSGTDKFKGSGRFYITDDRFEADNITDEMKRARAGSGAPIQNIKDFGFEVGGPIRAGKMWYWGSYGKQDIKAGIVGFYLPSATCQNIKAQLAADPLAPIPTADVRDCLGTDGTLLNNYNWKFSWAPSRSNKFSFQNTWAEKFKNARDASDTRPPETTYRQRAVSSDYGTFGWDVGPSPLWKAGDQHIFSDRLLLDIQWAHLGNNFILDFHEDDLNNVQPLYEITTGVWARSYLRSGPYIRPTHSLDATVNYFLPATLGGDHAFKVGLRWRTAPAHSELHRGGNTIARMRNGVPTEAYLYRDSVTEYDLRTWAFYLQDTFTRDRLTLKLGLRYDRQRDAALASEVPAHPFAPQWLPAVTFNGADSGVVWNDLSPRIGFTYDLTGEGTTLLNASWSIFYSQMGPGSLAGILNPVGEAVIGFPWADANGDRVVQATELDYTRILTFGGNYDPNNPSVVTTANTVDPNIKNERTQEFIVGFDHELFAGWGLGASYIWRKYDRFRWDDTVGLTSADYTAVNFTPTAAACPQASARCQQITYYVPNFPIPSLRVRTNLPDFYRDYNGFELVMRKRYSDNWMMTASYGYNLGKQHYSSANAYEDPTNIDKLNGAMYAPEVGGSGIDNVFPNAKWTAKVTAQYTLPWWDINVAAFYNARQGFPFPQRILTPSRPNRAGTTTVLLDPVGDVRHPNFQTIDFRLDKAFKFGRVSVIPSMDVFNLANANTILARRTNQNASNANNISGVVAPRVIRFGFRATW